MLDRRFSRQYLNFELSHREAAAATGVAITPNSTSRVDWDALCFKLYGDKPCTVQVVIAFLPVMSSLLMERRSFPGKNINCDEALRNLLGVESLLVSSFL